MKILWLLVVVVFWSCAGGGLTLKGKRATDFEQIIELAKKKVFPALVYVKPIREEYSRGEKKKEEVFGSGVIISAEGLVVTNNHVAEKAVQIKCVLYNKEQVPARLLGRDPETDLALLQLEVAPENLPLPYAEFGDADTIEEGQFVMALGAPFGFTRSISLGIISNTRRYLGFETIYKYNNWIQTDAAINPGNSGGPLVNTEGKIVGINTLALVIIAENVGFAIPCNVVKEVVERIERNGAVTRSWLGIELQALKDFNSSTFIDAQRGVLISDVEKNSPAAHAGLKVGDLLLAVGQQPTDGMYVEELPPLRWLLADLPPEQATELEIQRGEEILRVAVIPLIKGRVEGEDFDCHRWDMTVKEINKYKNPELYFYRTQGIYIQGIRYPGNARDAGLQANDIIISIDRQEIRSLEEVKNSYRDIVGDEKREKKVLIEVMRSGYRRWVVLDYRKNYKEEY